MTAPVGPDGALGADVLDGPHADGPALGAFRLDGRVAVVTGASRGLGREAAVALASAGATVVATGRDEASLAETCALVEAVGPPPTPVRCEVTDEADVAALADTVRREHGRVDVLVNNAGVAGESLALDIDLDEFRRILDVNVLGSFLPARALVPLMRERGSGVVVNVGSVMGTAGTSGLTHYGASKSAVFQLTRGWAVEWSRFGVRVNCVALGYFPTDINGARLADPAVAKHILGRVPLRRFGVPHEVGPTIVYLASDASSYMTGHVLYLDGGMSAR